ncbi:hypothetical protein RUND412_005696 [Rhizina undulata]
MLKATERKETQGGSQTCQEKENKREEEMRERMHKEEEQKEQRRFTTARQNQREVEIDEPWMKIRDEGRRVRKRTATVLKDADG